jgi:uncharacterized membrane protein
MLHAQTSLSFDPAWPWSLPGVGPLALGGVALALSLLTVWTYLGVRGATFRRVLLVLILRLLALAVALLLVLRPSVGFSELEGLEASKLLVVVDDSASMAVTDDFNGLSRWESAKRLWGAAKVTQAVERLAREQKVEVVLYQGSSDLRPFEPSSEAKGTRTEMGLWLNELSRRHAREGRLRGVLLFSDGIDNGSRFPALDKARQFRTIAPVHTFGHGNPDDPRVRQDIALARLQVSPQPVPIKTSMTLRALAHAPGMENSAVEVSVWIEDSTTKTAKRLGSVETRVLKNTRDNEIVLTRDAPEQPDEYRVTVKIKPLPGETNQANNEISTYVQVTKEGLSVLWVDRARAYEPTFAQRFALGPEKRFRVYASAPPAPGSSLADVQAWYQFGKVHYDVIVIGDLTASRFSGGHPEIFTQIKEMVERKKTGLMMLGGYDAFANGGWQDTPLAGILPVKLDKPGQLEQESRMLPTAEGLQYPFLRLDNDPAKNDDLWRKKLGRLDGIAYLGTPAPGSVVLATRNGDEPLLVAGRFNLGRLLVFGGDSTWKAWRASPDMLPAYNHFWKHAILWLAHQEESGGNLWVELDQRRLLASSNDFLSFTFGLRGKTGLDRPDAKFAVKVVGPKGEEFQTPFAKEGPHQRGTFRGATTPGEYQLRVDAEGKDVDGTLLKDSKTLRFVVESEDVENLNLAADHEFLAKLASAGGGRFHRADEPLLLSLLDEIKGQVRDDVRVRVSHWPDWRRNPASESAADQLAALWQSMALVCFAAFAGLVFTEWGLRRWWGLV